MADASPPEHTPLSPQTMRVYGAGKRFLRQFFGLSPAETAQRSLVIAFWRSAIGLFIALRLADGINAITGLWVIPSQLPSGQLGAVLPLLQIGAVLAIPVSIFAMVFTRHLCAYAVSGDSERTRGLLRDALAAVLLTLLIALLLAAVLMPWVCRLLRIAPSAAGYLTVGYGLLAAFAPMAWAALQALRRFGALSTGALLAAPLRLAAMVLLLPGLGLSGYFIAQSLPSAVMIAIALLVLRPLLKQSRQTPWMAWRNDLKAMLHYAAFIALGAVAAAIQGMVITVVIRHRLSDELSGAYYLLSRFAEIATYSGTTLATVLFPFALEARLKGLSSGAFRAGVMSFILLLGGGLAALFYWLLPWFFTLVPGFSDYIGHAAPAAYLTLTTTLNAASTLYFTHAAAEDCFTYLRFSLPCALLSSILLWALGCDTLMSILHLLFITAALQFSGCLIDAALAAQRKRNPAHPAGQDRPL